MKIHRWRYRLDMDTDFKISYPKDSNIVKTRISFMDDKDRIWLVLSPIDQDKFQLHINRHYAWDGCTPSFPVLDLFWIGTPDGLVDWHGKPIAYHASLIHDVLCQFSKCDKMPFSRSTIDKIFYNKLKEKKFKLARLYYLAVRIFSWLRI